MLAKLNRFDAVPTTSSVSWGMQESSAEVVFCGCFNTPVGENWGKTVHVIWEYSAVKCRKEVKFMLIIKPLCLLSGDYLQSSVWALLSICTFRVCHRIAN